MPSFGASIVLPEFVAHGGHSSSDRVAYLVGGSWEDQFPRRFFIRQRLSLSQYLPAGTVPFGRFEREKPALSPLVVFKTLLVSRFWRR